MRTLLPLLFVLPMYCFTQNVGINTTGQNPETSAMLDVNSTDKGILIPRVALTSTTTAAPINNPAVSLLVYNTATAGFGNIAVKPGFYFWDGNFWNRFDTDNNRTDWKTTGNSNTTAGNHFVGTTNAQPLDFKTNGTHRFRIADGYQVYAMSNGTSIAPFYSWGSDKDMGMYRAGTNQLGFVTNGKEKLRIPNSNQIYAMKRGTESAPFYSFKMDNNSGLWSPRADAISVSTNGLERIQFGPTEISINDGANNYDFRVEGQGESDLFFLDASSNRIGIGGAEPESRMDVRSSEAFGSDSVGTIAAFNSNISGVGLNVGGQGCYYNGLTSGSAISSIGATTSIYASFNTTGYGQAMYAEDAYGANWEVGAFISSGGGSYRKIIGSGTVSTIVEDTSGKKVVMNCPETPENLLMDYGVGKLNHGKCSIQIDPNLSKNIRVDENHPLKVFVQLEGQCNGVYVTSKSKKGFDVVELDNGSSNVSFSYSIVATMADQEFVSTSGEKRISHYGGRWDNAPDKKETLNPTIPNGRTK